MLSKDGDTRVAVWFPLTRDRCPFNTLAHKIKKTVGCWVLLTSLFHLEMQSHVRRPLNPPTISLCSTVPVLKEGSNFIRE